MTGINDLHATKAYKCQQVGECRAAKITSIYCRIPTKEAIESLRKDESTTPSGSPLCSNSENSHAEEKRNEVGKDTICESLEKRNTTLVFML